MSGGRYSYKYMQLEEFISDLREMDVSDEVNIPIRHEFIKHLELVVEAMHAIEWVDSGDCSPPHDADAIRRVLNHDA